MALGCALINPAGNRDVVTERRWSGGTLLRAEVSPFEGHQEGITFSQLSFCGYLLGQIIKDAGLDINKSIFKSNLLHSGS